MHLCFRVVRRLTTLEETFWADVHRHRLPVVLGERLRHFKDAPTRCKYPYEVVPMSSVPPELIRPFSFPVHPAKLTKPSLRFSVDLVQGMADYLRVLAEIFVRKELAQETNVSAAIERYRNHLERTATLQKSGRKPQELPKADLDVEMVWLAHMIRTKHYREVCELNFGVVVDHRLPATQAGGQATRTRDDWRHIGVNLAVAHAGSKDGMGVDISPHMIIKDQSWFAQFLQGAAKARARWEAMHQQGSSPGMEKGRQRVDNPSRPERVKEIVDWFCELLLTSHGSGLANQILLGYERTIYLMARYPHRIKEFSPSLLVDLVWHVHQVHPVAYLSDMKRVTGVVFDHRPWPSPKAGLSQKSSLGLWAQEFQEASYLECELTQLFRS